MYISVIGAGESGKSTVFKQMKLIYGEKFNEEEKKKQLATVYMNTLQAMKILCEQTAAFHLENEVKCQDSYTAIKSIDDTEEITPTVGDHVKALWTDPGIQMVWARRNEFQIIEAVQYFFNKIDEIKDPNWVPQENDIVHCRVRTAGIVTEVYNIDGTVFEMYDVGGQRNERKKWIHCFEGVTAVIFVAAISEYDQNLFEDVNTNRMTEALNLFDDICNNAFFTNSSMILFLNKRDLFEIKIKIKLIREVKDFSDFSGQDGDYDAGVEYFVGKCYYHTLPIICTICLTITF
jgi:GTPase SAR1 family protein